MQNFKKVIVVEPLYPVNLREVFIDEDNYKNVTQGILIIKDFLQTLDMSCLDTVDNLENRILEMILKSLPARFCQYEIASVTDLQPNSATYMLNAYIAGHGVEKVYRGSFRLRVDNKQKL